MLITMLMLLIDNKKSEVSYLFGTPSNDPNATIIFPDNAIWSDDEIWRE